MLIRKEHSIKYVMRIIKKINNGSYDLPIEFKYDKISDKTIYNINRFYDLKDIL